MGVSPPRNTEVTINYHFPDVVVMAQDAEDDLEDKADDPNARKDDLSKRYKERYDRKMEEMKKTVSVLPVVEPSVPSTLEAFEKTNLLYCTGTETQ